MLHALLSTCGEPLYITLRLHLLYSKALLSTIQAGVECKGF